MKRLFTMMLLVMVIVGFSIGTEAGVKTIRPDQLKPRDSRSDFYQNTVSLSPISSSASFSAFVKLPVGKQITKIKYYHKASGSDPMTYVELRRIKMGEESQFIGGPTCEDDTNTLIPVVIESEELTRTNIKSGYNYYLSVYLESAQCKIYGIKIFYK